MMSAIGLNVVWLDIVVVVEGLPVVVDSDMVEVESISSQVLHTLPSYKVHCTERGWQGLP